MYIHKRNYYLNKSPLRYYKVRCKCDTCGTIQCVPIEAIHHGEWGCIRGSIKAGNCPGKMNYYTDSQEDSEINAAAMLGYLNAIHAAGKTGTLAELIDVLCDDISNWHEAHMTPAQMGWVGSNGLP